MECGDLFKYFIKWSVDLHLPDYLQFLIEILNNVRDFHSSAPEETS